MADTPTPRPLTGDDLSTLIDRVDAWCDEWHTTHPIAARDLLYEILGELLVTRAEVDRLTANLATTTSQRDAADDCLRHYKDGWRPGIGHISWIARFGHGEEAMTHAQAQALRRARAAQPQEGHDG